MLERVFVILLIIVVSVLASVLSIPSLVWFVPAISGVVSIVGLILEKTRLIDIGILAGIVFYFYANKSISFNFINLIILIILFFSFIGVWALTRRDILINRLKNRSGKTDSKLLNDFKVKSLYNLFLNLAVGIVVTILGALVALYSGINIDLSGNTAMIFFILLASVILLIIYLIVQYLPKLLE
jgi:hypothetical protein